MKERKLILPLPTIPSRSEFFEMMSIKPGGLAAQLVQDVYKVLFIYSVDLKAEYRRYYSVEYDQFSDYLKLCHGVRMPEADENQTYILHVGRLPQMLDSEQGGTYLKPVMAALRNWRTSHEASLRWTLFRTVPLRPLSTSRIDNSRGTAFSKRLGPVTKAQ